LEEENDERRRLQALTLSHGYWEQELCTRQHRVIAVIIVVVIIGEKAVSSLRVFTSLWNVSQPSQPY
jgi:hypothetical protein